MIDEVKLHEKIAELLDVFFTKRKESLGNLKLLNTLSRKNPYLYRAAGVADASEIVEEILRAHVSSSDETLFGNVFFEPLAEWSAKHANPDATVMTSDGEGVDVTMQIPSEGVVRPIAVKSGVNVFNAASKKKQGENFASLNKRLSKLALRFDPVVGYCYGRKKQTDRSKATFREVAGQEFWKMLTGDELYYIKIARCMLDTPIEHRPEFQKAFDEAKNRFVLEFLKEFSNDSGSINWDKLIAYNSAAEKPKKPKQPSAAKKPRATKAKSAPAV